MVPIMIRLLALAIILSLLLVLLCRHIPLLAALLL